MFHLYFGALDIALYVAAFFVSLSVSRSISDQIDFSQQAASATVSLLPVAVESVEPVSIKIPTHYAAAAKASTPSTVTLTVPVEVDQQPHSFDERVAEDCNCSSSDSSFGNQIAVVDRSKDDKPTLHLAKVKDYKLHGHAVVKLSDLTVTPPESVRRYKLRGKPVVRVAALEECYAVIN